MGLYAKYIYPAIIDYEMNRPELAACRKDVLEQARGDVLEIGFGTGLNLAYYPPQVRRLIVVDSHEGMKERALRRIARAPFEVVYETLSAEALPFGDQTFDTVVSTFTLCSVPNIDRVLAEVFRVLRSDGRLIFAEHGLSPEPHVQKWQHRLNWISVRVGNGCHLNRPIKALLEENRFAITQIKQYYLTKSPKFAGYMYQGVAIRP